MATAYRGLTLRLKELAVRRRSAYTLFELVLTAAVIAISATLAMPSLDGMSGHHKLTAAVDSVRTAWALGRAHAIEEGRPYRFAVVSNGDRYRLAPDDPATWAGNDAPAGDADHPAFSQEESLPAGVHFAAGSDTSAPPANAPTNAPASSGAWTTVAVFLPDGTARSDAEIRFTVKGARPATVRLRALTGAVSVQTEGGEGKP